ncbi:MAG: tol-pal system protein YbgF [Fibrobacterota bacterium]
MKKIAIVLSALLLTGCAGKVALIDRAEWDRQKAEQEALKSNLRGLEAQMEKQGAAQDQQLRLLKADLTLLLTDINHSMARLSGQLEENKYDLKSLSKTTEKLSERKIFIKSGAPGDSGRPADSTVVVEDKLDVQKLFQIARRDFNAREYDRAKKEFAEILLKYPKDETADDCVFWIGECLYVTKLYKEAITEYQRVTTGYPQGDMVPGALFKSGLCYQKLNDTTSMKKVWNDLIARFPYSDEAMQAKSRLAQ